MKNRLFPLGIMQGRLSPPTKGRIQAFPDATWRDEFPLAAKLGLSSIEWILESSLAENPLWSDEGLSAISQCISDSGVSVDFICVDYFMEVPLVRMSEGVRDDNLRVLKHTICQAARLGAKGLELPFVDASAISSEKEEDEICFVLDECLDLAFEQGIALGLETALSPSRFAKLLTRIDHPACRANYDSGNSASLGYDPLEEFEAYGRWINNVHIKDRVRGGSTVPLGDGDADIIGVLQLLKQIGYDGGLVLQAARGVDELGVIQDYIRQLECWMAEVPAGNSAQISG